MSVRTWIAAVAVVSAVSCTCGKGKTPTDPMNVPGKDGDLSLSPLPKAPDLNVPHEALPGAGQDLAVVASRPHGEVFGEVRPTVTFNRPVKSLEMVENQRAGDAEKPFATITPKLDGEWRWLGSASAEFVPKGLVPYSTEFTVTVTPGLKALDGAELKEAHTFTFTTPVLELQDVTPPTKFRWLTPDQKVSLLFNQPVDDQVLLGGIKVTVNGQPGPKLTLVSKVSIQEERRKTIEAAKKTGAYVEPLSDDERGWRNQQWRYVLGFAEPLTLDTSVQLSFEGSLHGAQGPLPMKELKTLEYRVYGPFKVSSAKFCRGEWRCPYGPLVLFTTNEVDLATLKDKVSITPKVELDWDATEVFVPHNSWDLEGQSPYVALAGKFRPGTQYKLTLAPGAADVFKQADGQGFSVTVKSDDLTPALITGSDLALIEASDKSPRLPAEVSNLKTLSVSMWKLGVPEIVQLVSKPAYERQKGLGRAADFSEKETLKYPRNHARVHPLELSKVLGEAKTGVALVLVDSPELEYHGLSPQLVQVTDLAAHVKIAPKASLVWVTRLSTGAPVADADVSLYDEKGAAVWTGKTNAEGFADVPGVVSLGMKNPRYQWEYPFALVTAQKDGDLSFTANTWASGVEPYEFGLDQGWEGEAPSSTGFTFTDRGIYRPGDTVHVKGVIRYRSVGELRSPADGSKVAVKVTDSHGEKVLETQAKVNKYGSFTLNVPIKKEAPTGYYSVSATGKLAGGEVSTGDSFRVEEYRAPQFRVDVETPKKSLVSGEPMEATVFARYLFGGAMAQAATKWSVHRSSTSFSTEQAPDFRFAQETWWWDDNQPQDFSGFVASGDGRADDKGSLAAKVPATEAPGGRPYEYTLEAEVTDVNRQTVAGRVSATVHPASAYVGLRSTAYFLEVGKEYPIDTLVVGVDGKRLGGKSVDVAIVSRSWKSVKKKDATGGFTTVSEPVETPAASCTLTSTADGSVPCQFKPATAGFFIVKATVKDEQGRMHSSSLGVYATGADWVAWQRNDTDRVELLTDKTKYDVGDVAKVLVKSPYPEAKAMLSIEREGVFERRLVDLKGSVVTLDVKVTEDMVPNVFASVLIMRPRVAQGGVETGDDPGRPNTRVGLVKLAVEKKTKRLSVDVKTDKPEYRPRDTVTVDVALKDSAGSPADGEVTLYVVDEAVLRLTDYQVPDPIDSIYPERPLSVRLGEPLLHLVRRRNYGEKGEAQGGGGGKEGGGGIRSNFKTTVLWSPTLETKDGALRTTFTLPDNLTEFRVMAVVLTQGDRFGSGKSSLVVNKPLMALPALPRFARVGDSFEAGVVVHARGAGAGEVTVAAQVEGGAELVGEKEKKVTIAEGSPKEVRFTFKGAKAGLTKFRFTAQGGGNSDGVEEKLPIELPVEVDAVATYGDTSDQRVEGITPPKDVHEDLGGLTVTLSSTSMGNFGQGLQQLIDYPYGCLEQQSSRLVPFIALREIAGQFGMPWPGADKKKLEKTAEANAWLSTYLFKALDVTEQKHPDQVINSTVASILSLQDQNGSFRYWSDAWCPNSWASAYATLSLARAKEVGFDVPAARLTRAEGYLANVVGGQCNACEYSCPDETRVFAAYVLARMKKPKPAAYPELYARKDQLSLFSRALLANAMYVGQGDRAQANKLMQELLNHAKESPKGVHLEEVNSKTYATLFHSDTRTTGVVLQALTDITPEHPYVGKMARYLTGVRQGNGEWRSTQEAAFSLLALTQVMRTKEKDTPDYVAKVAFGASELLSQPFQGRSMTVQTKDVTMKDLLQKAQGPDTKLTFSKEGTGVLYYSALMRYAPKALPTKSLDNGLFVQRWFEPYVGGGQTLKAFAGDLVRVRVRVASNQERHWTAFEVPLPAGLEPVDTSLATSGKLTQGPSEEARGVGYDAEGAEDMESGEAEGEDFSPWAGRFWSPFTHTEMRDSKVVLFADHLPPGVHVTSFVARATTPGTFILKPAKGTLMYEPEVWGRSEGGTFEVAIPETVSQR